MSSPEHAPRNPEATVEQLQDLERAPEIIDKKVEHESRHEAEKNIEKARAAVEQEAIAGREVSHGEHKTKGDDSTAPNMPRSRKESYQHTMRSIQSEMSAPARTFSKIIHNPIVEKASEVIGSTVARPDAILSGSFFACILVLGLYLMAKYYGFALQGFETIGAFIVGWMLGIVFDFLRTMITGKRS